MNKEAFIAKIKALGLFDKYADVARQKVNDMFGKNNEVSVSDFDDVVTEDLSYKIAKVKKKKVKSGHVSEYNFFIRKQIKSG